MSEMYAVKHYIVWKQHVLNAESDNSEFLTYQCVIMKSKRHALLHSHSASIMPIGRWQLLFTCYYKKRKHANQTILEIRIVIHYDCHKTHIRQKPAQHKDDSLDSETSLCRTGHKHAGCAK